MSRRSTVISVWFKVRNVLPFFLLGFFMRIDMVYQDRLWTNVTENSNKRTFNQCTAMVEAGVRPTQVTYGTCISRAAANREPKLATRFFRDMIKRGVQPDAVTLNSLINAHAKVGDVNKAYRSAKLMRKYGVAPTLVTYNSLAAAYANRCEAEAVEQLLQQALRLARVQLLARQLWLALL